jgi:pimeloyl-ACP methyl ester carboxylesterase
VDAYVRDLEAVVAALGLKRFPLLGISQGGAVAIAYAVRHPEQVSRLILYGAYARGRFSRGYSQHQIEQGRIILDLIRLGWGQDNPATRQYFTALFMPEATGEQIRAFNALQRVSASPENAARLITTHYNIEVTELARRVVAPTLVLHARDDGVVPMEESRHLAALIPGARFVALEGKNHILLESEPAWARFLAEVRRFLVQDGGS